jgi:hypothetical protein
MKLFLGIPEGAPLFFAEVMEVDK